MRLVFLTSGKGCGHLVMALSLFKAFKRAHREIEFYLLGHCDFSHLCEGIFEFIPIEMEPALYLTAPRSSMLYTMLKELSPDVLVTDGLWFPLSRMLGDFSFRKIIFFRQTAPEWFSIPAEQFGLIEFDSSQYDRAFSIEPGFLPKGLEALNPLVMFHRDEILSREEARKALGIKGDHKVCLIAHNGFEGELDALKEQFQDFDRDFTVISSTNREGKGIFPLAYFIKGIDLLVGGAGYNLFYEARYYGVESRLIAQERKNEDQAWRVRENSQFTFDINGADQLADLLF